MTILRRTPTVLLSLPLLLLAAGCDQPPTKEIKAAEAAIEKARAAEAETYVADRFREAQSALDTAQRKLAEKDYRGALSSANEASEKARAAAQGAGPARILAKSAAETKVAEIQAVLEEIGTVRSEASEAKVPDEAFADVASKVDELNAGLAAVNQLLSEGNLLGAQRAAEELKARTPGLVDAFRAARTAWDEAHPAKGKAKPKPKR